MGIDPGTRSFDICGVEEGEVFFEKVLSSEELAEDPSLLVETIEQVEDLDLIVGPSGYGVETTYLEDLDLDILEDWFLTYILLLKKVDLKSAIEEGNPGIKVYSAMTQSALEMKKKGLPVCYIPGVINLPTVPRYRKLNNLDMGTVDKLSSAVLAVRNQSEKFDIPYSETSFILVEMGGGYNAAVAVEDGRIVDGIGGTMKGVGFLSSGEIDMEMIQMGREWEKTDIFKGGITSMIQNTSIEDFLNGFEDDENYNQAWNRMIEDIEKMVASLTVSVSDPDRILLSGRLPRFKKVENVLKDRLSKFAPVEKSSSNMCAEKTKEAAQGYGIIAEGLAGGFFSDLIEHMEINDAKGTSLDYIQHPTGKRAVEELKDDIPFHQ